MIVIDENTYQILGKNIDFSTLPINLDLLNDNDLAGPLKKYLLLTYFPAKINEIDPLNLFYNRYYWFMKFKYKYLKKFGNDHLNLRQEGFKILEEGGQYENIDWSEIEKISKDTENDEHG